MNSWLVCPVHKGRWFPSGASKGDICPLCEPFGARVVAKITHFNPYPIPTPMVEPKVAVIADSAPLESIPEVGLWLKISRWWREI